MAERDTFIRAANEMSLAVWMGGSLMGASGLRSGAAAADGRAHQVESTGWSAWQPLQTAAILTQLASGAALTVANRERILAQRGVARASMIRTGLLGAAIALSALTARTASKVAVDAGTGTHHTEAETEAIEAGTRRLHVLEWGVPALTGALVVMDALMGEQQRPSPVLRGVAARLLRSR